MESRGEGASGEGAARSTAVPGPGQVRWGPYVPFLTFCLVATPISFVLLDRPITRVLSAHKGGAIYHLTANVDWLGQAQYYLAPAGLMYLVGVVRPTVHRRGAAFVFLSVAATGAFINMLKVVLGRARPKVFLDEGLYGFYYWEFDFSLRSFPSGHATTVFAGMTALAILAPRYRWFFWVFATTMGCFRVISLEHFPSDVFAGAGIGVAGAVVLRDRILRERFR